MKILVTGSEGFVGKLLVSELKKQGHTIIGFDLANGDNILGKKQLTKKMKTVDVVFHLAAIIDNENKDLKKINVEGTRNVVSAAVESRVKKFVFLSSTGVYGFTKSKVDEKTKINPITNYEFSKVDAEDIVLQHQEEINVCVLRSSMILGNNSYWKKMFKMIESGWPLPMKGTNKFQVVYIKDLISALISVMKNGETGETYLVAGKDCLSLNEIYMLVRKIYGKSENVIHINSTLAILIGKLFRIKILSQDNIRHLSKERNYSLKKINELDWAPKYSIEDALKEIIQTNQENKTK
jgi:nucleoside-diphosphate-sugar epimerase